MKSVIKSGLKCKNWLRLKKIKVKKKLSLENNYNILSEGYEDDSRDKLMQSLARSDEEEDLYKCRNIIIWKID